MRRVRSHLVLSLVTDGALEGIPVGERKRATFARSWLLVIPESHVHLRFGGFRRSYSRIKAR